LERELPYFLAECFSQALNDLFDHVRKIVLLKLFPGFFIAVGFVVEKIFLDDLFDHVFFALLSLLGHSVLNLFHLFDDFLFRVFPEPFYGVVELDGGHVDG
jgi:hypothetical protein